MGKRAEKADATRKNLIRVANNLFAERGYEATSIEEVLSRAEVSKGALYHHFPTKEFLFEAVFEENERAILERVMAGIGSVKGPAERLRRGCQAWLDITMDPAVRRISFIDGPAVLGWERWRELDDKYGFGVVKGALQHAMEIGEMRKQPVDLLAHILLAALGESAMVIARADDPKRARREVGETLDGLLDSLTRSAG